MILKGRQSPGWVAGIGNVLALLGRRIVDGKPGVQGEASSPVSVFHRAERNKAAIFYLYATNTSEQQREPAQ